VGEFQPVFFMVSEASRRALLAGALAVTLSGCGTVGAAKRVVFGAEPEGPKVLSGFIGGDVADEPRAALAARQILATGGNAADAAVALGFMLAVTLPSRASLGGGGACLAYQPGTGSPNRGVPEAVMFVPVAPAAAAGDRPAAVPMLVRGLYLLSARYGSRDFATLVAPAEQAARFGIPVSRALALDLAPVAGPLTSDPTAQPVFAPNGTPLAEGGTLLQADLAGTLEQISAVGAGDMYQGLLAHKLVEATAAAGGPVSVDDLRLSRPALMPPITQDAGNDHVSFLPLPADGGLAAAAAFQVLRHDPAAIQAAGEASEAVAARFRAQGGSADALLAASGPAPALPLLPASTNFVVVDAKGGAVACALTNNNLFGTGRIAPGTGILLAASPAAKPAPLLAASLAWNASRHAFRAATGGSGQNAAGLAAAFAMTQALGGGAAPAPEPGRANAIACPGYAPGEPDTCRFTADPRMAGLAASGN
jgi:gamma-glutamyltranspeptidase/glutathione hydrolase